MRLRPLNMSWGYFPWFELFFLALLTIGIELLIMWWFRRSEDFKPLDIYLVIILGNIITGLLGLFLLVVLG